MLFKILSGNPPKTIKQKQKNSGFFVDNFFMQIILEGFFPLFFIRVRSYFDF